MKYFCLVLMTFVVCTLQGCAYGSRNSHFDFEGSDGGGIEFINGNPDSLLAVIIYRDSTDCRDGKVFFGGFSTKQTRVQHANQLSFDMGFSIHSSTYNNTYTKSCSGIYTVPFSEGDLRISMSHSSMLDTCSFKFEARNAGGTWTKVENVVRRTRKDKKTQEADGGGACTRQP